MFNSAVDRHPSGIVIVKPAISSLVAVFGPLHREALQLTKATSGTTASQDFTWRAYYGRQIGDVITADAGGSNAYRSRVFKTELQAFADRTRTPAELAGRLQP